MINIHMKLLELVEGIRQSLMEINFNRREVVDQALSANIHCGFEAEILWTQDGFDTNLDDLTFVDLIDTHMDGRSRQLLYNEFDEWLHNSDFFHERMGEIVSDLAHEQLDDPGRQVDFIRDQGLESDLQRYIDNTIQAYQDAVDEEDSNESDVEALEEIKSRDQDEWVREFIQDDSRGEMIEYLEDEIRNDSDVYHQALDDAREEYSIYDWASHNYSISEFMAEYDVDIVDPETGLENLAELMRDEWAPNSKYTRVVPGQYHQNAGTRSRQDFWRVEDDGSIRGNGLPAEIISPVYDTPGEMLQEMASLFEWLESYDAETNRSTGLHVTMSIPEATESQPNRLKMALLVGDRYLLQQFDRLGNTYAESQYARVLHRAQTAAKTGSAADLAELEQLLSHAISREKFSSINFKEARNEANNNLIEFRIGGGSDYHTHMDRIRRAVIRYSTVMSAGYDPEAFVREYARAIFRVLKQASPSEEEIPRVDHPVELVRHIFHHQPESNLRYLTDHLSTASDPVEAADAMLITASMAGRYGLSRKVGIRAVNVFRRWLKKMGVEQTHLEQAASRLGQDVLEDVMSGWPGLVRTPLRLQAYQPPRVEVRIPADSRLYVARHIMSEWRDLSWKDPMHTAQENDFFVITQEEHRTLMRSDADSPEIKQILQKLGLTHVDDFNHYEWVYPGQITQPNFIRGMRRLGVSIKPQ